MLHLHGHVPVCPRRWPWPQAGLLPAGVTPEAVSAVSSPMVKQAPEAAPLRPATRPPIKAEESRLTSCKGTMLQGDTTSS